jgi:ribose transport system permease protein
MTDLAADTRKVQKSWKDIDLRAVAPFVALALLLMLGAIANPNFMSIDNLLNVITRSAFIAIIAVGATFVISAGGLDLSVGSMVAFVASLMIMFMNSGVIADPATMLVVAMALAIVIGAACGVANGLITTAGSIEPFIARSAPWVSIAALRHGCRRAAPSLCGPRTSIPSTAQPISARY